MEFILDKFDIAIIGGSFCGQALALGIKKYVKDINFKIFDAQNESVKISDNRSYAIALDCVRMLKKINVWKSLLFIKTLSLDQFQEIPYHFLRP